MRKLSSLNITWILFSFVSCSLESRIGSNWFKLLLGEDSKKRDQEIDFMLTMIFLKKQESTSVFSPLCCDINILVQCIEGDFGHNNSIKGAVILQSILEKMTPIVFDEFDFFTFFYKKEEISGSDMAFNTQYKRFAVHNEIYVSRENFEISTISDAERIVEKHSKWLKNQSNGLLNTSLKPSLLLNTDRIYSSYVYYTDSWAKKSEKNESYEDKFYLSN